MFPDTNPNASAVRTATAETSDDSSNKISFVFDFDVGDFVVIDGKVQECTGDEALKIWVKKIVNTQKNRFKVYDDTEYGVLIEDLIVGTKYSIDFVESELRRELEDALIQNKQIIGISSFECSYTGDDKLYVSFNIITKTNGILTQEVTYGG